MALLSIIIPARNERFLPQTVADIHAHATGEYEIVVALDGYWPAPPLPDHPRLKVIHWAPARGMRACINAAANVARGEYLMKVDAHTSFETGFDEILKPDCDDNMILIARRDRLDAETWGKQETGKPPIDLHYLSCPITNPDGYSFHGAIWPERDRQRLHIPVDETMSFQGSMWMMRRSHWERLGGMPEEFYGSFTQEPQQLGMKTWLGGGQVMVSRKTTYLHLHKGSKYGRMYSVNRSEIKQGHYNSAVYWMNNKWKERKHDLEWLVDRFAPVPTWPDDWQARRNEYVKLDL